MARKPLIPAGTGVARPALPRWSATGPHVRSWPGGAERTSRDVGAPVRRPGAAGRGGGRTGRRGGPGARERSPLPGQRELVPAARTVLVLLDRPPTELDVAALR